MSPSKRVRIGNQFKLGTEQLQNDNRCSPHSPQDCTLCDCSSLLSRVHTDETEQLNLRATRAHVPLHSTLESTTPCQLQALMFHNMKPRCVVVWVVPCTLTRVSAARRNHLYNLISSIHRISPTHFSSIRNGLLDMALSASCIIAMVHGAGRLACSHSHFAQGFTYVPCVQAAVKAITFPLGLDHKEKDVFMRVSRQSPLYFFLIGSRK